MENIRRYHRHLRRDIARVRQLNDLRARVIANHPARDSSGSSSAEERSESSSEESANETREDHEMEEMPQPDESLIADESLPNSLDGEAMNDTIEEIASINSSSSSSGSSENEEDHEDEVPLFANEEEKSNYVRRSLRDWATSGGCTSMRKVDSLLKLLNPVFPQLPKSYKTLLETPSHIDIRVLPDGSTMWYKSIKTNLDGMLLDEYLNKYNSITLDVNMDGLPLSKSSKIKFWPILGYLVNTYNQPFIIGVYYGEWDPIDVHSYLHDYVNELEELFRDGYVRGGISYPFSIRNYILDAPARALVKCCVGHGGYGACEKCSDPGETVADRRVYLNFDAPLRTDESYRNQDDALHHVGRSILERILTGMVSQFRLDPFHLVWHGVFKRLLTVLNEWNGPWKLTRQEKEAISNLLLIIAEFCPSDFCRLPRAFEDWKMFKATEERRMCLYDGVLIFRDHLQENVYKNYLLLHAALFILSSPVLVETMCAYAEELLNMFLTHAMNIYGRKFVVYNVHCLCHLGQECRSHGTLDSFSAFMFENSLKSLKDSLKSTFKPLQQAAFRDIERTKSVEVKLKMEEKPVSVCNEHVDPEEQLQGTQYKRVVVGDVQLKLGKRDSCYQSKEGDIFILKNVVKRGESVYLIGNKFLQKDDFYNYPLPSSTLGIFKVWDLDDERHSIPLNDVFAKCWLMPDGDSFLCTPLLHSTPFM